MTYMWFKWSDWKIKVSNNKACKVITNCDYLIVWFSIAVILCNGRRRKEKRPSRWPSINPENNKINSSHPRSCISSASTHTQFKEVIVQLNLASWIITVATHAFLREWKSFLPSLSYIVVEELLVNIDGFDLFDVKYMWRKFKVK